MKTRLLLSLSLLGLLFNTSCKKDDVEKSAYHLEISNTDGSELTEMSFDEDAASGTFKIQSDGIWEIIVPSDAQWISVSPASGKNDATVTVLSLIHI